MSYYPTVTNIAIPPGVGGLGDASIQTQDPPASWYCRNELAQIEQYRGDIALVQSRLDAANRALEQSKIDCGTALSAAGASCGASASAAAYGASRREQALNEQIARLKAELDAANAGLASANSKLSTALAKTCPVAPKKSCLFWIITTIVASGVAAVSISKSKKDDKKKPGDKKDTKSLTEKSV